MQSIGTGLNYTFILSTSLNLGLCDYELDFITVNLPRGSVDFVLDLDSNVRIVWVICLCHS